jgi:hypothetical protein
MRYKERPMRVSSLREIEIRRTMMTLNIFLLKKKKKKKKKRLKGPLWHVVVMIVS